MIRQQVRKIIHSNIECYSFYVKFDTIRQKIICTRIMHHTEIRGLPFEKNGEGRMGW